MRKAFLALLISTGLAVTLTSIGHAAESAAVPALDKAVVSAPVATPEIAVPVISRPSGSEADRSYTREKSAPSIGVIALSDVDANRGVIAYIDLEKRLGRRVALFARINRVEFAPNGDEGDYGEGGRGSGIEVGVRFRLIEREKNYFYLGAGIGAWELDWYWKDDEKTPFETGGARRSWAASFQVHAGWRFGIGTGTLFLNPTIQAGSFFPQRDDDPLEFGGLYSSLGLSLGMDW